MIEKRQGILVHGPYGQSCQNFGYNDGSLCPLWIENKTDLFMDCRTLSGRHCGEDILELRSHIRRRSVLLS